MWVYSVLDLLPSSLRSYVCVPYFFMLRFDREGYEPFLPGFLSALFWCSACCSDLFCVFRWFSLSCGDGRPHFLRLVFVVRWCNLACHSIFLSFCLNVCCLCRLSAGFDFWYWVELLCGVSFPGRSFPLTGSCAAFFLVGFGRVGPDFSFWDFLVLIDPFYHSVVHFVSPVRSFRFAGAFIILLSGDFIPVLSFFCFFLFCWHAPFFDYHCFCVFLPFS